MSCSLFCASVLVVGVGSICGSPGAGLGAAPGALASGNARRAPATKRL